MDQDPSLQVTAIRETFEETGVLLAKPIASGNKSTELPDSLLDEARKVIHAQKLSFGAFLAEHALEADTSALWPFSQWITPPTAPKRFHTRFYVSFLPKSSSFQPEDDSDSSRARKHHLPTSDGGIEVVAATFLHPKVALSKFHQGEISLMPPQYYILSLLSGIFEKSLDVNTQEQRDTVLDLARGTFGRMVINPRGLVSTSSDKDRDKGKGALEKDGLGLGTVLTYEGDETRGGSKGRLHRVIMWTGKGGVSLLSGLSPLFFSLAIFFLLLFTGGICSLPFHVRTFGQCVSKCENAHALIYSPSLPLFLTFQTRAA